MPELPEVETIRSELESLVVGRTIRVVRIRKPDIVLPPTRPSELRRRLRGARVVALERRAKSLLFRLDGDRILQTQVRMTGRFSLGVGRPAADFNHIAAEFDLDDGRTLYYDDIRRLGGFRLLAPQEWLELERRLGPEPLARTFTARRLAERIAGSRAPIKNAILDQRRIAGIGNIYAAEALHRARIDPRRVGGELTPDELRRLHRSIRVVLRDALAREGTTLRDYRAVNGRSGRFQEALRVYGKEGRACGRCGAEVERIVQAGRSTFFCPGCQG